MIEWNEQHQMIREAMQRFVAEEIVPNLEALEHGDMPTYDILRKLYSSFGMDEMARSRFEKTLEKARKLEAGEITKEEARKREGGGGDGAGLQLIPIIELS